MSARFSHPLFFLLIRFVTLGLRFLFVALFFKHSEALFGEFSLIATTVMLGVYLLGMDFYTYAQRELLSRKNGVSFVFLHQLLFYLLLYVLVLPAFYLVFKSGFLSKSYWILFYAVLVGEHLSFEVHRLLFVMKKPLAANVNLFFRNGFWVLPVVYFFLTKKDISLHSILIFWLLGDILSLFPLMALLTKDRIQKALAFRPDWPWLKKGWKVSIPFFLATFAFKVIELSDRYFIDYFYDKATVGVYSFFGNISYLVNTVVFTAVISLRYPGLVESILSRDAGSFRKKFSVFKQQTIRWTILSAVGVAVFLPVILVVLNKRERLEAYPVFLLLLLSNVLLNLSLIYHYVLYGFKKDRHLLAAAFSGMLLNVGLNFIVVPGLGMLGAALTTLTAMLIVFLIKFYRSKRLTGGF